MKDLKRFFKQDQLAETLGIELIEVSPGRAKTRLTVREQHYNSLRMVHGGTIFALADVAFAAASNAHGTAAVAINATISFLKATKEGTLTAEAVEESLNPKLATYTIRITDDQNEIVAIFQGMVYRKKDPLVFPKVDQMDQG